jgi:phosphatidylinositol kinase/protein kinase (PI-3  family)
VGRLLHESVVEVNEQAMRVTRRIETALNGRELNDHLIAQAPAPEHLAQMFVGWCAFW